MRVKNGILDVDFSGMTLMLAKALPAAFQR